jgi:hypothetical protein
MRMTMWIVVLLLVFGVSGYYSYRRWGALAGNWITKMALLILAIFYLALESFFPIKK